MIQCFRAPVNSGVRSLPHLRVCYKYFMKKETGKPKDIDSEMPGESSPADTTIASTFLLSTRVITWLSASVVGITIILGTFGFLAIYAHDFMLGIDVGLRDSLEYVTTGGLFLANTGYHAIYRRGISLQLLLPIFTAVVIILSYTLLKGRKWIAILLQSIAILGLILIQLANLKRTIAPLSYGGFLLYAMPITEVNQLLVNGDIIALREYYGSIAASTLVTSLIIGIWYVKSWYSLHHTNYINKVLMAFKTASLFLAFVSIYGLPLDYGVLMMRNYYPTVRAYSAEKDKDPFSSINLNEDADKPVLFLLYQGDKELVFYNKNTYQIIYVKREAINYVSLGQRYNVFNGRELIPKANK